jgi:hypothetical protein
MFKGNIILKFPFYVGQKNKYLYPFKPWYATPFCEAVNT